MLALDEDDDDDDDEISFPSPSIDNMIRKEAVSTWCPLTQQMQVNTTIQSLDKNINITNTGCTFSDNEWTTETGSYDDCHRCIGGEYDWRSVTAKRFQKMCVNGDGESEGCAFKQHSHEYLPFALNNTSPQDPPVLSLPELPILTSTREFLSQPQPATPVVSTTQPPDLQLQAFLSASNSLSSSSVTLSHTLPSSTLFGKDMMPLRKQSNKRVSFSGKTDTQARTQSISKETAQASCPTSLDGKQSPLRYALEKARFLTSAHIQLFKKGKGKAEQTQQTSVPNTESPKIDLNPKIAPAVIQDPSFRCPKVHIKPNSGSFIDLAKDAMTYSDKDAVEVSTLRLVSKKPEETKYDTASTQKDQNWTPEPEEKLLEGRSAGSNTGEEAEEWVGMPNESAPELGGFREAKSAQRAAGNVKGNVDAESTQEDATDEIVDGILDSYVASEAIGATVGQREATEVGCGRTAAARAQSGKRPNRKLYRSLRLEVHRRIFGCREDLVDNAKVSEFLRETAWLEGLLED